MTERVDLLKTDARGRVRVPNERREELLNEFERSGLSGPKFAALIGVKYQTFAWWVQQRRQRRERETQARVGFVQTAPSENLKTPAAAAPLPSLQWIEASVEPAPVRKGCAAPTGALLSVSLPGGARLEIADASQVDLAAQLLTALSGQRC